MKKIGLVIMMAMVVAATVQAETLALWENDNIVTATNSTPVDIVATDMSAGDLELGPGFLAPGTTWPNALDTGINANATNLAAAIANNHYYTFTVTPDAGKQADYANVAARVTLNSLSSIGTSVQLVLMSSATGFADGDEVGSFMATTPDGGATDNGLIDIDVSGVAALQDQPSPVEFRLYAVVAGTEGSYNRLALGHIYAEDGADDVRVDGIVEDATSLPVVTLAEWDLDGTVAGSMTSPVDTVHSNMSSTALTGGSPSRFVSTGWPDTVGTLAENWRLSGYLEYAISTNNYFGFTLTPDAGKRVDYDKLFARFAVNTGNLPASDVSFILLSDKTGFTTNGVLGSFTVTNAAPGYVSTIFTHEFDLSTIPELQDLAEPTEFRIYFTSFAGNRMAIGHNNSINGSVDLRVEGSIEELPYVPATILSWASISDTIMKLVVDAPSDPALYYPKGNTDLVGGTWTGVPHSDNAGGPFIVTNLSYSAAEGSDEAIYVETTGSQKFFGIGEE